MKPRDFIALLSCSAAWPTAAAAQQPPWPTRIGARQSCYTIVPDAGVVAFLLNSSNPHFASAATAAILCKLTASSACTSLS